MKTRDDDQRQSGRSRAPLAPKGAPARRWLAAASGAFVAAIAFACASPPVVETVRADDGIDFATLKTFHIIPTEDAEGRSYLAIEEAIVRELSETGRTQAPAETADMWVVYRASTLDRQKRRTVADPDANAYRIVSYVEGTLAIDVFDRDAAQRIWHGQTVVDERSREALLKQADRIVKAILDELPEH